MPEEKEKTKAEKAKEAKAVKAVEEVKKEAPLKPVPKRIRINFSGANKTRSFTPGDKLRVPEDVPEDSARAWLASGKAFEDKSGEGPTETK